MKPTIAILGLISVSCTVLAIAPSTVAQRSVSTSRELVLMMDLDSKSPGLEKIYKTQFERSITDKEKCPGLRNSEKMTKNIFVKFELERQGKLSTLLEYKIGTNLATYWVHQIKEVRDLNRDGSLDFVFYAGDDTSQETVLLLMKGDQVKAIYAGITAGGSNELGEINQFRSNKPLSVWDREREVFVGKGIVWTRKDCVTLRKTPDLKGEAILSLGQYEVLDLIKEPQNQGVKPQQNRDRVRLDLNNVTFTSHNTLVTRLQASGVSWQRVSWLGKVGWVDRAEISDYSPVEIFPLK